MLRWCMAKREPTEALESTPPGSKPKAVTVTASTTAAAVPEKSAPPAVTTAATTNAASKARAGNTLETQTNVTTEHYIAFSAPVTGLLARIARLELERYCDIVKQEIQDAHDHWHSTSMQMHAATTRTLYSEREQAQLYLRFLQDIVRWENRSRCVIADAATAERQFVIDLNNIGINRIAEASASRSSSSEGANAWVAQCRFMRHFLEQEETRCRAMEESHSETEFGKLLAEKRAHAGDIKAALLQQDVEDLDEEAENLTAQLAAAQEGKREQALSDALDELYEAVFDSIDVSEEAQMRLAIAALQDAEWKLVVAEERTAKDHIVLSTIDGIRAETVSLRNHIDQLAQSRLDVLAAAESVARNEVESARDGALTHLQDVFLATARVIDLEIVVAEDEMQLQQLESREAAATALWHNTITAEETRCRDYIWNLNLANHTATMALENLQISLLETRDLEVAKSQLEARNEKMVQEVSDARVAARLEALALHESALRQEADDNWLASWHLLVDLKNAHHQIIMSRDGALVAELAEEVDAADDDIEDLEQEVEDLCIDLLDAAEDEEEGLRAALVAVYEAEWAYHGAEERYQRSCVVLAAMQDDLDAADDENDKLYDDFVASLQQHRATVESTTDLLRTDIEQQEASDRADLASRCAEGVAVVKRIEAFYRSRLDAVETAEAALREETSISADTEVSRIESLFNATTTIIELETQLAEDELQLQLLEKGAAAATAYSQRTLDSDESRCREYIFNLFLANYSATFALEQLEVSEMQSKALEEELAEADEENDVMLQEMSSVRAMALTEGIRDHESAVRKETEEAWMGHWSLLFDLKAAHHHIVASHDRGLMTDLVKEVDDADDDIEHLEDEVEGLRDDLLDATELEEASMRTAIRTIFDAERNYYGAECRYHLSCLQLSAMQHELEAADDENDKLHADYLQALQKHRATVEAASDTIRREVEAQQTLQMDLIRANRDAMQDIEELTAELAECEDDLETIGKSYAQAAGDLGSSIQNAESTIRSYVDRLQDALRESMTTKLRLVISQQTTADKTEELDEMEEENEMLQEHNAHTLRAFNALHKWSSQLLLASESGNRLLMEELVAVQKHLAKEHLETEHLEHECDVAHAEVERLAEAHRRLSVQASPRPSSS